MSIPVMLVNVGIEYGNLATIQRWLKRDGEPVQEGEPLLTVETAKATADVVAPASGTLQILAPQGTDWDVNEPVAVIGGPRAEPRERSSQAGVAPTAPPPDGLGAAPPRPALGAQERLVRSSPGARKLAKHHGIPIHEVPATGPYGRVIEADVRRYVEQQAARVSAAAASPAARRAVPLTRIRRIIAERMLKSAQGAAHVTLTIEADMEQAAALRAQLASDPALGERGRVGYTELVVKSAARALRRHPSINACLEDGQLYLYDAVHVGVAVAVDEGLLVAVLRDADRRPLLELGAELQVLAGKARQGRLSAEEMSGATFTVTNLGAAGVDAFTPIIHQPAAAILGVGAIRPRVVARDGKPEVRLTSVLSLSFDHRIVDGAPAATFLAEVRDGLEKPYRLLVPAEGVG